MKKKSLIHHKKQLFYLLCLISEKDILDSEQALLAILEEDLELQAELVYTEYINGE